MYTYYIDIGYIYMHLSYLLPYIVRTYIHTFIHIYMKIYLKHIHTYIHTFMHKCKLRRKDEGFYVFKNWFPDRPLVPPTVLINPVITPIGEELEDGWEGCLSVPGLR